MPVTHEVMAQVGLRGIDADPRSFFEWFDINHYRHPVILADGSLACVGRLMYTDAVLSELTPFGYGDRWCFKPDGRAVRALDEWARLGLAEPRGWHRHPDSGRRVDEETGEFYVWR